jgi:putative endonuclease
MEEKQWYVYILSNISRSVLYVGVTNNLHRRLHEHRHGIGSTFTQKYHVNDLIYFERYNNPKQAIKREKQIKSWSRKRKNALISIKNPDLKTISIEY